VAGSGTAPRSALQPASGSWCSAEHGGRGRTRRRGERGSSGRESEGRRGRREGGKRGGMEGSPPVPATPPSRAASPRRQCRCRCRASPRRRPPAPPAGRGAARCRSRRGAGRPCGWSSRPEEEGGGFGRRAQRGQHGRCLSVDVAVSGGCMHGSVSLRFKHGRDACIWSQESSAMWRQSDGDRRPAGSRPTQHRRLPGPQGGRRCLERVYKHCCLCCSSC
jgi:hypothetical protein